MLESLLCGVEQLEERYLKNFSEEEKRCFRKKIQEKQKFSAEYREKLGQLMVGNCSAIFRDDPLPNSKLEIKYILNRIASNDPRDTVFELDERDIILNPDRLALYIAKAFRGNTNCKVVVLRNLGLTDNGLFPILNTLRHNTLSLLDIGGNTITKTISIIDGILSDPNTRWEKVKLGKIQLNPRQQQSLERHQNASFEAMSAPPRSKLLQIM